MRNDESHSSIKTFSDSNADFCRVFPDDLREMTGFRVERRFLEIVKFDFVVPKSSDERTVDNIIFGMTFFKEKIFSDAENSTVVKFSRQRQSLRVFLCRPIQFISQGKISS